MIHPCQWDGFLLCDLIDYLFSREGWGLVVYRPKGKIFRVLQ